MITFVINTMVTCRSCGDKRVDDISKVPGIYEGQAELQIPENLKKMVKPDSTGKSPIPDGPIPCKLEIKENENKELTIELVDFKMPMKGMELTPSSCRVVRREKHLFWKAKVKCHWGQKVLYLMNTRGKLKVPIFIWMEQFI